MFELSVSWLAVLLAAAAGFLAGWYWYHPKVFGTAWAKSVGFNIADMKCESSDLLKGFANNLLIAFVLALFFNWTGGRGLWDGAVIGFWSAIGFVATSHIAGVIWEKRPMTTFWITTGGSLFALVIMGAVIGLIS